MTFPNSQRVIFRKNPLVQVICQLRFPPVLGIISKEPAEFQDLVRSTHPLYEKGDTLPPEIAAILLQLPIPNVPTQDPVHKFLTDDRTNQIDLTRDFLAIATTQYTMWEKFEQTVELAKAALERIYHPTFYSRIGLRYRDIIDPSALNIKETSWPELIRDSIVGLLADKKIRDCVTSTQGRALLRLDREGEFLLLQHGLTSTPGGGQGYAIDADFYTEGKRSYDEVISVLGRFNREAGNFFRWAITERLSAALEPVPLE